MSATRRPRRFPLAAPPPRRLTGLVLLGALALSGCQLSRDDQPTASSSSSPSPSEPTATVTVTETPSASPTPTPTPTPGATASASTPALPTPVAGGPDRALLSAAELPRLNDSLAWTQGATGPASRDAFGLCAKFDLGSIGAMSTVQRSFAADGDTAAQQVAEIPDAQTGARMSKVLQAWHDDCRGRVQGRNVTVRPVRDVAVSQGKGSWYLVSYVRGGQGHFHSFGAALNGSRLTLLRIDQTGQDHNYEPGREPMELAVKAAAAKLGG